MKSVHEDVRIWNPCALLLRIQNGATIKENSMEVPEKIKNRIIIWSSNPTSGNIPKECKAWSWRDICYTHVNCSIIHNSQEVEATKCLSMDDWIKKMCYIHTMEYYAALKKKEILSHATTWMILKDNVLSKIS